MAGVETVNLQELVSACFDLGGRAGELVRTIFETKSIDDLGISDKSEEGKDVAPKPTGGLSHEEKLELAAATVDPQTIADTRSQQLIVGSLKRAFSSVAIVAEEGNLSRDASLEVSPRQDLLREHSFPEDLLALPARDLVVWIDPLDGTKEYTLGMKEAVTTLIGITYKGVPIAGVVNAPFSGKTVWGVVGVGVFGLSYTAPEPGRRWIVTSRSHMTERLQELIKAVNAQKVLQVGGAGSKGLMVLEGQADAYFFPQLGTKKWDTCAIEALFRASGGCLTDAYGADLPYSPLPGAELTNTLGVLATRSKAEHANYVLDPARFTVSKF